MHLRWLLHWVEPVCSSQVCRLWQVMEIYTTWHSVVCKGDLGSYATGQLRGKNTCKPRGWLLTRTVRQQRTWRSVAGVSCCCPAALSSSPSGAALSSASAPQLLLCSPPPTAWTERTNWGVRIYFFFKNTKNTYLGYKRSTLCGKQQL